MLFISKAATRPFLSQTYVYPCPRSRNLSSTRNIRSLTMVDTYQFIDEKEITVRCLRHRFRVA
jgi:hypothetical protein